MKNKNINYQLEKLISIGTALSSEINIHLLLEMIVQGAKEISNADGCTLYRIYGDAIKMEIVHSDSLGIKLGGTSGIPVNMPDIPLYLPDGSPNLKNVVSCSIHGNKTINILDAYNDQLFDFSGTKAFDRQNNYHSKSFLAVPMKNHQGDIIGILQLINSIDKTDHSATGFDAISQHITEALASQAAIVLTKQCLISDLENMFESLIQLIATAIDDKSPHTGGHCRRVPELTMLLAEAAHNTQQGYLKDFTMTDADRYELKIAGWLHDCGKITTPECVIDKATKLQTIFDRIGLIETRFEVAKRDQEIAMLKQQLRALEKGEPPDTDTGRRYLDAIAQLNDDLDFIRSANTGGEFMSPEDQARVSAFSQKSWCLNGETQPLLSDDEIYNLNITRGTLTAEERGIINHHIVATIAMLEKITFPKHLKNVPEYAGGHHERMDGAGYPKGLCREQMSIQARAMAIADIFEALTAKDRPYKLGKKLSEALSILKKMKDNQHIDPDLYDAFIEQKVYKRYAEQFLDDYQMDVD
ncbi:MAG: HD domain-containing phosphohydrolase [Methylovulum sp.]|nr:HD domain-containing phosphohydrolase [Methylovulum sp.]